MTRYDIYIKSGFFSHEEDEFVCSMNDFEEVVQMALEIDIEESEKHFFETTEEDREWMYQQLFDTYKGEWVYIVPHDD